MNLLGNAFKFTEKGDISLYVSQVKGSYDSIKGHLIRFEVKDTGIGIPNKVKDKLFKRFSQADISTTRLYGGTGLGLSICKQLSKLMGEQLGLKAKKEWDQHFGLLSELK